VGEGTCCQYRIEAGNTLRPLPLTALSKREAQQYSCHAWVLDNDASGLLVVGGRRGEVLVVQEGEVRQALQLEEGVAVESLAAFGKVREPAPVGDRCLLVQSTRALQPPGKAGRHSRLAADNGHECLPALRTAGLCGWHQPWRAGDV
jgi:hypothetical protein